MASPSKRKARSDRGVALILTLLVLAVLVVVVVQFSYAVKVEKTIVQNGLEDQQLMCAVRGVVPYLGTLFRDAGKDTNPTTEKADTLASCWDDSKLDDKLHQIQIGECQVVFRVEDLERRFPLEWLADDQRSAFAVQVLTKLLTKLQVDKPDDVATKIANKVRELAGKEPLPQSAPGQPPAPPTPPVAPPAPLQPGQQAPPPRRALFSIEQLLDTEGVEGMDVILYGDPKATPTPKLGLADFVTCWPTASFNINTVSHEVMVSFLPTQTKPVPTPGTGAAPAPQPIDVEALCKKIRAHRIDPLYETESQTGAPAAPGAPPAPPPPPPPPPASGTGAPGSGSGASKGWASTSKAFQMVQEHGQSDELKGYFPQSATPGQPGQPAPPAQPAQPAAGQVFDFTQALSTTSRFYAVYVTATAPSGNVKVVRLVVARNKQNLVAPLLLREEPK